MPGRRARLWLGIGIGAVGAIAIAVVAVGVAAPGHSDAAAVVVRAGDHSCLLTGHPHPGAQMFTVDDLGPSATEVDVFGSGATLPLQYGDIADVGPATSAEMPVDVGPGTYTLVCEPGRTDDNPVTSSFVVTGRAALPQGVAQTSDDDFAAPIRAYKAYVTTQLSALSQELVGLRTMVAAGDRAGAEADYPVVHANYERIGAVYDAFGVANDAINGLADGLPGGAADPSFTGFHKLEAQLWGGAPTADLLATLDDLATDVYGLSASLPGVDIDSLTYATRAHEILENALQEQVTGLTEPYSHTGIDDAAASTTGAEAVVATLRSLLLQQDDALVPQIDAGFARLQADLATLQAAPGAYLPDTTLTTGQREQLTAAIGALLEQLAHVPGLITPPQDPRDVNEH